MSCAGSGGPVSVDAEWNLTCPADSAVECGSLAQKTCLGSVGQRAIVAENGQTACTGDPVQVICEVVERANGSRTVTLKANVGSEFSLELLGATVDTGGVVEQTACNVTIFEDGLAYDTGACGTDPPSMEQPCQLSNVSVEGSEVAFDLQCRSLLSGVTLMGFDVGAVGGGPASVHFMSCLAF